MTATKTKFIASSAKALLSAAILIFCLAFAYVSLDCGNWEVRERELIHENQLRSLYLYYCVTEDLPVPVLADGLPLVIVKGNTVTANDGIYYYEFEWDGRSFVETKKLMLKSIDIN